MMFRPFYPSSRKTGKQGLLGVKMMTRVVMPKSKLGELVGGWIENYRVAAPVINSGKLVFEEIKEFSDMVLDDELTYKSPKEYLFPQVEKIMSFGENEARIQVQDRKTVIFGVRPCDLHAFEVMTAVFTKGKFIDTYFEKNLNNTIFAGMGCLAEKSGCFCSDRGLNRNYSSACDIFFSDSGETYTVEIHTEKGAELFSGLEFQEAASPAAIPENAASGGILEIDADENDLFSKIDWAKISEKCMGCGICTFICPTCHCFEFRDTVEGGEPARYRCWDSCMYPRFTLHASGHNPRASKKERYRQRIMHKYLYVKHNFGYTACTGCGRCIRSCPAGMNIKSVVAGIIGELGREVF
ncbi:MAG: 4Fe-4S ferredoxin [Ruminiclostridium sp.]|nr:4Fe-4S ferredoxin [Ruminiclostridium sp.]